MSDPLPNLQANTGSQGTPSWTTIMGANTEIRWSDQSGQTNIASASWPQTTRPGSVTQISFLYQYTADSTGAVIVATFALSNYNQLRWDFSSGNWASAPLLTCYPSTGHGTVTAGDGSILGGQASDTGSASYIKATAYGFFGQTPGAAPTGAFPTGSDHTAGSVTTGTGAWSNAGGKWQDLQAETNYILNGQTPSSAGDWYFMIALFTGPNMTPGLWQPTCSLKYTFT